RMDCVETPQETAGLCCRWGGDRWCRPGVAWRGSDRSIARSPPCWREWRRPAKAAPPAPPRSARQAIGGSIVSCNASRGPEMPRPTRLYPVCRRAWRGGGEGGVGQETIFLNFSVVNRTKLTYTNLYERGHGTLELP